MQAATHIDVRHPAPARRRGPSDAANEITKNEQPAPATVVAGAGTGTANPENVGNENTRADDIDPGQQWPGRDEPTDIPTDQPRQQPDDGRPGDGIRVAGETENITAETHVSDTNPIRLTLDELTHQKMPHLIYEPLRENGSYIGQIIAISETGYTQKINQHNYVTHHTAPPEKAVEGDHVTIKYKDGIATAVKQKTPEKGR